MKKLLFLGCNHLQLDYLKAARDLGFFVIGTDRNPQAPGSSVADEFQVAGYLDHERLKEVVQKSGMGSGDLVFTASAHFAYEGAARVAREMGLVFPSAKTIDTCLDKSKFYALLESCKIPIPPTRIYNEGIALVAGHRYYLKSDYGKTPRYNYYIKNEAPELPAHDLYYRNCFLLQEEIAGQHYRVNLYGDEMALFITVGENVFKPLLNLPRYHGEIHEKLKFLRETLGLGNWLLKFDVLMDEKGWYVIDLGLDPPMRLRQLCQWQNVSFCNAYIRQYLLAAASALPPWRQLCKPVEISGTSGIGFSFHPPSPDKDLLP